MPVQEDDNFVINGPEPLQPLINTTLGELIYSSLIEKSKLNQTALVDAITSKSITYGTILTKSCLLAEALRQLGYKKGTIISICSENSLEFFIPVISALYLGAITAPLNHNYTDIELAHCLNITKPKIVFCSKATAPKYLRMRHDIRFAFIERVIIIDRDNAKLRGAETLDDFIAKNAGKEGKNFLDGKFEIEDAIDPGEQTAFVMSSSGTTGLPKGVMITHRNVLVRYMHMLDPRYTMEIDKDSTFFGILPFFHSYGLITNLLALQQGQKIVVLKQFEPNLFLKSIQDYKISTLYLAPPLIILLAKSRLVDKYDLSSIQEIACGGAPLSRQTEELVRKRLKLDVVRQGYGLTESTLGPIIMGVGEKKSGSSGKVVTYMSCKVRDPENGRSMPPGQVGELCFKGAMVMKGYFGNEQATRNSFTSDGWLLTGDLAYYDKEGYFYIVDRLKELIKYKAFQVAPAELEAVLLTHPKIQDAGVVGLPREDVGELPLAFVVKNPNTSLTEKEVQDFVAEKVSQQKRLRGGVIFVQAIPKNPSGKILRRELRNMLTQMKSKL